MASLVFFSQACFLDGDEHTGSSQGPAPASSTASTSCSNSERPQIVGLDVPPTVRVGASGDYELTGRIRYQGCVVTREVFIEDTGAQLRSAPLPADSDGYQPLTFRLPASKHGTSVDYYVTVIDTLGNESSRMQERVYLE